MAALFHAKHIRGMTRYVSNRTGIAYIVTPEDDGFNVSSEGAALSLWTAGRSAALSLIETTDLARLANTEASC